MTNEITHQDVNQYYNESYYKDLEGGRPRWHYSIYLRKLRIGRRESGKQILDVACGIGNLLSHAGALGIQCSGIDISDRAVAFAKQKYPSFDLRVGVAESLPWPSGIFDFLTCLGSLEHFLDQQKALSEMLRVTKVNARFLIMVPNKNYPDFEGTDQQKIKETLLNLEEWKKMLLEAGFNIIKINPDHWPMHWIEVPKKNPIKLVRGLYKKYKLWSLPLDKSYQFMFVLNKHI
jgi:SAM-dependent methyltransferase